MLFLMIATIGAAISAVVASGKARSALGWGLVGFLFPLIGVVAVLCLPPLAQPEMPADAQQ